MDMTDAAAESVPTMEQINERTSTMTKLVDCILRGRAQPSCRNEAAAAVSDIRAFVRAWRPAPPTLPEAAANSDGDGGRRTDSGVSGGEQAGRGHGRTSEGSTSLQRPSADVLLKLAQRGVQLHNTARKLPQVRDGRGGVGGPGGGGGGVARNDWRSATVAYLRTAAASLVSLGSTSSPKDCANLCRLFSKAGELLVEDAGDDIRALEMFEDASVFFNRLPGSFYGASGQGPDSPALSTEDLIMAVHKAASRRIEVLSRTTGDVDQMTQGYEQQLKLLATRPSAGLTVSTAVHATSVGEERFKKGDCRGASRLLRVALQALSGGETGTTEVPADRSLANHTSGLRRTILFSLAHCCSKSGDHNEAIKCIAQLERGGLQSAAGEADFPKFLFAKCKVLTDAGDLNKAYESAKALVAAMPAATSSGFGDFRASKEGDDGARDVDLDIATARMFSSSEDCSDRSLELFASIATRSAGTPKAIDAQVELLRGIAMAARLRAEGCGAAAGVSGLLVEGATAGATAAGTDRAAAERAETIADDVVSVVSKLKPMALSQVEAMLEVLVMFAEFFQGREEWEACARWCARAIVLAKRIVPDPRSLAADSGMPSSGDGGTRDAPGGRGQKGLDGDKEAAAADSLLLASLLTLRGEMECRMGDFSSSSQSLDQALVQCPTYDRAREVAFWSAARDSSRDESSLSARLSALSGPRSGLAPENRPGYLAKCVGLVVGAQAAAAEESGADADSPNTTDGGNSSFDSRVAMVQERLLDALLLSTPPTPAAAAAVSELDPTAPAIGRPSSASPSHHTSRPDKERHCDGTTRAPAGEVSREGEGEAGGRSAPMPMEVEDEESGGKGRTPVAGCAGGTAVGASAAAAAAAGMGASAQSDGAAGGGNAEVPTAIQVVAAMVDAALGSTSDLDVSTPPRGGNTGGDAASVLSRVLLSVDKTLRCAGSLGVGPLHDPDIQYLSQGCWNLAIRCCGTKCDLPWAEGAGSATAASDDDEPNRMLTDHNDGIADPKSKQNQLLGLAPAFFKASRNWTEIRSDANAADALLTRQNCMILSIAATLELYDSHQAEGGRGAEGTGSSTRRAMLERARKEVEAANGLNRQLSEAQPEKGAEMRSTLLVAEMSVLGRIGDTVAARSLVAGRESDFLRCSFSLVRYCVQLAEDVLGDDKLVAGLCRLCIRRCVEDDPVDTRALGDLYRRLLVSAASREDALLVVDDFTTKVRDLQEGPGMPSEDVDYFSAKCYNLGLQLMEMGRPAEAERLVGKALGLVKLGSSEDFSSRWAETIFQVYRTTLQAKDVDGVADRSLKVPIGPSGRLQMSAMGCTGKTFLSTGLFPMPS